MFTVGKFNTKYNTNYYRSFLYPLKAESSKIRLLKNSIWYFYITWSEKTKIEKHTEEKEFVRLEVIYMNKTKCESLESVIHSTYKELIRKYYHIFWGNENK